MKKVLDELVQKINDAQFPNEQAIKQGIVLRVLDALGWAIFDHEIVWPEFYVSGGHADFALCHPAKKPLIFLEVKQGNTFNTGEEQLLMKYAFQHGVPIAILTDGRRWSFYLPSGNGSFEERRFYHLDLVERDVEEVESVFVRYLSYERVQKGQAVKAAKDDHDNAARKKAISAALPSAWNALVKEQLTEILLERVEIITGFRPQESEIADFLGHVTLQVESSVKPKQPQHVGKKAALNSVSTQNKVESDENWYRINDDEKYTTVKAVNVTLAALRALSNIEPLILEEIENKLAQEKKGKVVKRRILARTRDDLYTNPALRKAAVKIQDGWWLGTNYSNRDKTDFLDLVKEIAQQHHIAFDFSLK